MRKQRELRVPFTEADEMRWRANSYQQQFYRLRGKGDTMGAEDALRERDEYRRRACEWEAGQEATGRYGR